MKHSVCFCCAVNADVPETNDFREPVTHLLIYALRRYELHFYTLYSESEHSGPIVGSVVKEAATLCYTRTPLNCNFQTKPLSPRL